ncbi:MAG TPA: hypothetical protein VLY03_07035 [Bacteroidota bacterium]|nr:hypothetical protein [Bacteroidota bacterium]
MHQQYSLTALLAVFSLTSAGGIFAQDSFSPIILSPRVGLMIHAETRAECNLFPQVERFDSAMVLRDSKGNYGVCVMYTRNDGLLTDTVIGYAPSEVSRMSEQIDHQEGMRKGTYHIGDTTVTLVVGDWNAVPVQIRSVKIPAVEIPAESHISVTPVSRRGEEIRILTKRGERLIGELLWVQPDKLLMSFGEDLPDSTLASDRDLVFKVEAADIVWLKIQGHSNLGSGVLIGFASGACIGALMGASGGDDPPDRFFSMTAGQKALLGGTIVGVGGLLAGAIVGAASSTSDKMIDQPSADALMSLRQKARYDVQEPPFLRDLR